MELFKLISGYYCKTCDHTVFSRARHDMRGCKCFRDSPKNTGVAVDGGREYFRVLYSKNFDGEYLQIESKISDQELFEDWNSGYSRWGLHKGKIERID